jgi:hypothetical protein
MPYDRPRVHEYSDLGAKYAKNCVICQKDGLKPVPGAPKTHERKPLEYLSAVSKNIRDNTRRKHPTRSRKGCVNCGVHICRNASTLA